MVGDFKSEKNSRVLWTGSQTTGAITLNESIKKYKLAVVTFGSTFGSAVGAVTDSGIRVLAGGASSDGYFIQFADMSISKDGLTLTINTSKYMNHVGASAHGGVGSGYAISKIEGVLLG